MSMSTITTGPVEDWNWPKKVTPFLEFFEDNHSFSSRI